MSLALRAGDVIKNDFQLNMKKKRKADRTPVTVTDEAINQFVLEAFHADFPHIDMVGEEGSRQVAAAEYRAFCDPVDGTFPFSHGVPTSTFVLSVLREDTPLVGVIYDPFMNRMWCGEKGKGAFLNGKRIQVSPHATLKDSRVCMIWWPKSKYNLHEVCRRLMNVGSQWDYAASIALFGALAASGESEATIYPGQSGWETAAIQVITEEAGGVVTDVFGNTQTYGPKSEIQGHVVSNGIVHDELIRLIEECQAAPQQY